MTAFLIWLLSGGIVGWLASIATRTESQQGVLFNVVVGAVGAFLASLAMGNGSVMPPDSSLRSFAVTFVGAALLLSATRLVARGRKH